MKDAMPKDAAAVILLRENSSEVFLAQRNPKISFLGGFHAFPGGKVDKEDAAIKVRNCADEELAKFIACAVRETFEEVGVLLVRGGDKITKGQRASVLDDLISGRFSFAEILRMWGLWIDAADFRYAGFWTTPKFSPVRFKTRFFLVVCPRKQEPRVFGEFVEGKFIAPPDALKLWKNSEILISPPVLLTLQALAESGQQSATGSQPETENQSAKTVIEKLLLQSQKYDGKIRCVRVHPSIAC
ncbi:MAG TPA: NUDIX domain-containing protein, partial [Pyrinomonadaceae bacterium]